MDKMPTLMTVAFDELIESGDIAGALEFVRGYVAAGSIEALFLSSTVSRPDEALAAFEARSLRDVEVSASKGYAPALYQLGCYYKFGDFVEADVIRAVAYFELAAKTGLPASMYEYGLALLHGDGVAQNSDDAMSWIGRAAEGGDDVARDFLLSQGASP